MLPDSVLYIRQAGLQDWQITSEAMHQFTDNRQPDTPDEIWLVQHPPIFTQGQAGKAEHILSPGNIPVVNSDRGGQVTYHGPGQQVMYVLLDIRRRKMGVRQLVTALEETVIETLASFDMEARARPGAPGVYIGQRKICSLGLRIRHGCSLHGLALNINMDLAPFLRINPCGYAGMEMMQMRDAIPDISPAKVTPVLVRQFVQKLGYSNILRSREDQLDVPFFLQRGNPDHP